jgi:hypothetical protein
MFCYHAQTVSAERHFRSPKTLATRLSIDYAVVFFGTSLQNYVVSEHLILSYLIAVNHATMSLLLQS